MRYQTKYSSYYPPLLARLTGDIPNTSAELYLSLPKKWITIGEPIVAELMFTGEWDPVWPGDVDAVIEQLAADRPPERARYWLVSLDPDAPHVIVRSFDGGPLVSYMLARREWITPHDDDPLLQADRADWDEMLLKETGVVGQCLEHAWHHRRAFPGANDDPFPNANADPR
jgi:hypothetical protein